MSGSCSRCGSVGETEYGADGLSYCSSCLFYALNRQCNKCRMYLPATELQQFRGNWACPYCIQDMRDEEKGRESHREKDYSEGLGSAEQCERCGRQIQGQIYIWNGKRLCRACLESEQGSWGTSGGGPMSTPLHISSEPERKAKGKSLFEAFISELMGLFGMKKKAPVPKEALIYDKKEKMPLTGARPMSEGRNISAHEGIEKQASIQKQEEKKDESVPPQIEGIMIRKAALAEEKAITPGPVPVSEATTKMEKVLPQERKNEVVERIELEKDEARLSIAKASAIEKIMKRGKKKPQPKAQRGKKTKD